MPSKHLDPSDELHRQVRPDWRDQAGTPMSMNFRPNRSDSGLLSTRQAKRLSSQEAYESHLAEGLQSCGTWSFTAQETGLNVIDDSAEPGMPEGHASVDFTELTRGQAERRGKEIRGLARLTYTPDEVTSQA